MGLYVRFEDVRLRVVGKILFTPNEYGDDEDPNKMPVRLANRLIEEAEGDVEHDLSPRYASPFQTDTGDPFSSLPRRPTREMIRTLCELKAVIRFLETDFGRGTAVDGDDYTEKLQKRYDKTVEKLLEKKKSGGWAYPPLPSLRLNYMNEQDDGFSGQILVTSSGDGDFPREQINDPSENFWNGALNDLDDGSIP